MVNVLSNTVFEGWVYHFPSCTNACRSIACHACFTRGCQEEYPMHGVNQGSKPYLSKCEEKDFFSTHKYLKLDMGKVCSKYKLAANAICDKGLLNYQMGGLLFYGQTPTPSIKK